MAENKSSVKVYATSTGDSGWSVWDPNQGAYFYDDKSNQRVCYAFTYTPSPNSKASQISLSCSVLSSSGTGDRTYCAKLYKSNLPSGTPIATTSSDIYVSNNYASLSFTFNIPDDVIINTTTDLCVWFYSENYSTNVAAYGGTASFIEQNMYNVTYHANGHGVAPTTVTWSGSSVVLPEMAADDCVFLGWSESAVSTTGITGTYTPTSDVTLYAVWKRIFTIIYDSNGIGNAPNVATVIDGDSITLPVMSVDGYDFYGWATEPSSNDFMTGVYTPTGSITLYAIWELGSVLVIFNDGEYNISLETIEGVNIEEKDLKYEPSELGKRFEGWYNANGVKAEVGKPWEDLVISGKIKLYSKWYYDMVMVDGHILFDIADAIRTRRGQSKMITYSLEEMPMAIGSIPNVRNLLDNSDFTNPVNQRGETSYSGIKYTIDRWYSNSGYSVVTVNSDCVNIKSSNGNPVYLQQFIESGVIKSGRSYTVGCTLKDGSVHCMNGVASTDMVEAIRYIYVNDENLGTIRFKYDSYYNCYMVVFSTDLANGIDVSNVALYEGEYTADTLPEYRPKGYGIEMVECMRYYQTVQTLVGSSVNAPQRQMISLTIPMREVPKVGHIVIDGVAPDTLSVRDKETVDVIAPASNHSHIYITLSADIN